MEERALRDNRSFGSVLVEKTANFSDGLSEVVAVIEKHALGDGKFAHESHLMGILGLPGVNDSSTADRATDNSVV